MKAYTCYILTAVAVILVHLAFSLLNVFFQSIKEKRMVRLPLSKLLEDLNTKILELRNC